MQWCTVDRSCHTPSHEVSINPYIQLHIVLDPCNKSLSKGPEWILPHSDAHLSALNTGAPTGFTANTLRGSDVVYYRLYQQSRKEVPFVWFKSNEWVNSWKTHLDPFGCKCRPPPLTLDMGRRKTYTKWFWGLF